MTQHVNMDYFQVMNKKQASRSRAHNFRYWGVVQRYVTIPDQSGRLLDDYYNIFLSGFKKSAVMASEQVSLTHKRLLVEYNLQTRWTDRISIQDRIMFLESGRVQYNRSNLLCVQTLRDKTGRREYLDLRCSDGAYCGQAGVQPVDDNVLVFKPVGSNPATVISAISDSNSGLGDYAMKNLTIGRPDLVMVGSDYRNHYMVSPADSNRPMVVTPNTINKVSAFVNNQEYEWIQAVIPEKDLFIYQAPVNMPLDSTKTDLLYMVFTN